MKKGLLVVLCVVLLFFGCSGKRNTGNKAEMPSREPYYEIRFEGNTYRYLETPADIFFYDLTGCAPHEEDDYLVIPHERWALVYHNTDLFVLSDQAEEAIAYYADPANYTWSVRIEEPESDNTVTLPLTIRADDYETIIAMDRAPREQTLLFADIQLFGTLVRTSRDGLLEGRTGLACHNGSWYWRSEVIDDTAEGWPEYVVPLPDGVCAQIKWNAE